MRAPATRFILLPALALGGAILWGAVECLALFWSRLGGRSPQASRAQAR